MKRKPPLRATTVPHGLRTRIRTEVGRNTVDVGTHDVVIQRPRYPTAEEKEIWPETEIVIDIIKIHFERDSKKTSEQQYTVKAGVCHQQEGAG